MDIRINLVYHPLYVLGRGRRVGVWFQGCSLGCEGCISQHTWSQEGGQLYTVQNLVDVLVGYGTNKVTISGGEPFEQSESLKALLIALRKEGIDDILIYSGFDYGYLQKKFADILELIDVLVVGRFERDKPTEFVYKGSDNQEMIVLNKKLETLYQPYQKEVKRRLQVTSGEEVFVLGIPDIRDEIFL